MSNETIRVGVIGAGGNTKLRHIPGLQAQDAVDVMVVANRTTDSGQRVADEFGIAEVAASWLDVIADDRLQAVCIGTWPYMHAPLTIAALEAGKHVLCEARMAMNSTEARSMLTASRRRPNQIAQIVPAPHTLAFDRTIVDLIGAGYIGDLVSLDAHVASPSGFPQWDSPVHWRHRRDLSGNSVMSMGIWYEAIMRWIGPAATVTALGQSVVRHRTDEDGRRIPMAIPDHIEVLCRMPQGGQMRIMVSTVIGLGPGVDVHIYGTEGTIRLTDTLGSDGLALFAGRRGDEGLRPVDIEPAKRGAWRVEEEFINAIRGTEPVTHTDFVTGVTYMEWTDAVARSLQTGETMQLPL